ncbi:HtaA domain-containing protein [Prauserella cavernicola]|uniref:HtaA domain-containing protein n=1 Tax=Prauserella cavernicola TaxID=2800127 RepID=A0A934V7C2_9PSEU|nr:HtaA domain-containing protein [Prauserella cavernicola]MBK1787090.1 HtaA domain-containing protein [Prauserella cavernicola]
MTEDSPGEQDTPAPPPYGLNWAIKASFIGYVARMPDGRAYLGAGAAVTERNELAFPLDADTAPEDGVFAFGGDVRFSGHFGLMFVQIAQPRVVVRDGDAEMTVLDPASKEGKRLRLVTFGLTGPHVEDGLARWEATDVRLAPDGVELFGDVYVEGEPFEPLTITVPRQEGNDD